MHSILDHHLITERYFFPRRAGLAGATHVEAPGGKLACWRSAPPSEAPVLLHFHGNGEVVADYIPGFNSLIQSWGVEVFFAEYRGYGASDGAPALAAMLGDVPAIVEAVGVPRERIVVFGRSVGSIYAIEAASTYGDLGGLVLESGIADVGQRIKLRVEARELGCSEAELDQAVMEHLDHASKMKKVRVPLLVMHAEQDHLVTLDHAERNYGWAGSDDKRLCRFPRGDHNTIMFANQAEYFDALHDFLNRTVGVTAAEGEGE